MKISAYTAKSLNFQIYQLNNAVQASFLISLRPFKINFIQSLALLTIYFEGKNKVTPMALVRELGISKSSVSQTLSELERKGKIKRRMDDQDARSLYAVLTAEGKSDAAKIIGVFETLEKKLERMGNGKIDTLNNLLKISINGFEN